MATNDVRPPRGPRRDRETVKPSVLATRAERARAREALVGVFVIAALFSLLAVLFTMTDLASFLRRRYHLTAVVEDAAGLRRGDPVQLRGVTVGRVKSFKIVPRGVAVRLELEDRYGVPPGSVATIRSSGILGGMNVDISPSAADGRMSDEQVIEGRRSQQLGDRAAALAEDTQRVLERVQALLSDKNLSNVEASGDELSALLRQLSMGVTEERKELGLLGASLNRSAKNLERATGPELARSVARIDDITSRIDALTPQTERTVASLDRSSQSIERIVGRIDRGEGTLGKLLRDDTLYQNANSTLTNLNRTSVELGLLSKDIRQNPKRYVQFSVF